MRAASERSLGLTHSKPPVQTAAGPQDFARQAFPPNGERALGIVHLGKDPGNGTARFVSAQDEVSNETRKLILMGAEARWEAQRAPDSKTQIETGREGLLTKTDDRALFCLAQLAAREAASDRASK